MMKKHYDGLSKRMLSEIECISELMSHPGEKGRSNEFVLAEFLKRNLPQRLAISTGKVIAADGQESGQIDLIIHDRLSTPALVDAHAWSLVPVESVYAVISVKTTLTKPELEDAARSIQTVRSLPRKAAIFFAGNQALNLDEQQVLRPRAFIFAFKSSWATAESAENTFRAVLNDIDDSLRPNGVCILDQCFIVRKPFSIETIRFPKYALMHFFVFMVQAIDNFTRHHVDLTQYFTEDYGR